MPDHDGQIQFLKRSPALRMKIMGQGEPFLMIAVREGGDQGLRVAKVLLGAKADIEERSKEGRRRSTPRASAPTPRWSGCSWSTVPAKTWPCLMPSAPVQRRGGAPSRGASACKHRQGWAFPHPTRMPWVLLNFLEEFYEYWLSVDPEGTFTLQRHNLPVVLWHTIFKHNFDGGKNLQVEVEKMAIRAAAFIRELDVPDHDGQVHFLEAFSRLTSNYEVPCLLSLYKGGDQGLRAAKVLLDAKAGIDEQSKEGSTALYAACQCSTPRRSGCSWSTVPAKTWPCLTPTASCTTRRRWWGIPEILTH